MKKYGEKNEIFFPQWQPSSISGHSPRYIYNFKTASKMLHTHRRHINEETYWSVFSFVEYFIFNHFVCEKHKNFPKIRLAPLNELMVITFKSLKTGSRSNPCQICYVSEFEDLLRLCPGRVEAHRSSELGPGRASVS